MASEIDYGYAQLGTITLNDDLNIFTFHKVETYNKPLGKYSPIFYSVNSGDGDDINNRGYGEVCSTLGTNDNEPYGIACYSLFTGTVAYVVDDMSFGEGNVNTVACYTE